MNTQFQENNFRLEGDTICWKEGTSYALSSIKHLIYRRVLIEHRVNLTYAGKSRSSDLCIVLDNGQKMKLSIKEGRPILFVLKASKSEYLEKLNDLYVHLAEKTFEKRISSYIRQIEKQGYFEYTGDRFYPHSKVVHRNTEFSLENTSFYHKPGYLVLRLKSSSFIGRIKSALTAIEIPTDIDTDVFFMLLDNYMGLRW